ncbi:MAG: hypothetical protein ABIF71_10665 [Planctomycetota bacterium]
MLILFCLVFTVLIYLAQREGRIQEEQTRQDQQAFYFVNEGIGRFRQELGTVSQNLDSGALEGAMQACGGAERALSDMEGLTVKLSDRARQPVMDRLKAWRGRLTELKDRLQKGDVDGSRRVIEGLMKELKA